MSSSLVEKTLAQKETQATVAEIGDNFVTVEISNGVQVRVQRGAIANVLPKGTLKSA